jgi:hypothetical protein
MARLSYEAQLDLRLGDLAGEILNFSAGIGSGGPLRIEAYRQTEPVAQRVSCCARDPIGSPWAGVGTRVGAVSALVPNVPSAT